VQQGHQRTRDENNGADQLQCGSIAQIPRATIDFTFSAFALTQVDLVSVFAQFSGQTTLFKAFNGCPLAFDMCIALETAIKTGRASHLFLHICTVIPTFGANTFVTFQTISDRDAKKDSKTTKRFHLKRQSLPENSRLLLETIKRGLTSAMSSITYYTTPIYSEPMKMEDLITVTFCNQSASEEGRFIVCLFADTRFFERHPIF